MAYFLLCLWLYLAISIVIFFIPINYDNMLYEVDLN